MPKSTPEILRHYRLIHDAYNGSNGFTDGGYLFQYEREINFGKRKKMASYTNFLGPIVDAKVKPVFSSPPVRSYNNNELMDLLIENADNNGTPLTDIIEEATLAANLYKNAFIVMDMFEDVPSTLEDVIYDRRIPYVYVKTPMDVYEYESDDFGKLTSITFFHGENTYKKFDTTTTTVFTKDDSTDATNIIAQADHGINEVPVVYLDTEVLPFPNHYGMATLSRKIYNVDSEINDLSRSQMFNILVIPGINSGDEESDGIIVSTDNALFVDPEARNLPGFIGPDSSIMDSQLSYFRELVKTLIQSADVLGSSAIATGNTGESGIALTYRFYGKQQALKISSKIAAKFDTEVMRIFNLMCGEEPVEYSVAYENNFAPTIEEIKEKITVLKEVMSLELGEEVEKELKSQIILLVGKLIGLNSDRIVELVSSNS